MTTRKKWGLIGFALVAVLGFGLVTSAYAADDVELRTTPETTDQQIQPSPSSEVSVTYDDKTYALTLNANGDYDVSLNGAALGTITPTQLTQISEALQIGVADDLRAMWGYEKASDFFEAFVKGQLRIIGSYQQIDENGELTEMFIFVECGEPKPAPEICPAKQYVGSDEDTSTSSADCITKDDYNAMYKWATRFNVEASCPSAETTTPDSSTTGDTTTPGESSSATPNPADPTTYPNRLPPRSVLTIITPVVYLYSPQELNVAIDLNYDGQLTTYPEIGNGWKVRTQSNGKLANLADGREYNYLVWEGVANSPRNFDMSRGFVVSKSDTKQFLQTTLDKMGLTQAEVSDFIGFWMGRLMQNDYNLIHFATTEEISRNSAKLNVQPQPDSSLRIFMVYQAADQKTQVLPQTIKKFTRHGFSLIEWGGAEAL